MENNKKIQDEDVMISTSISDLEKMLEGVDAHASSKFEKYFVPALGVFSSIIIGMFVIVYSVTTDMARLADAMDPKMDENMSLMALSVASMAKSVGTISNDVGSMKDTMNKININIVKVSAKMDRLEDISDNMIDMNKKMDAIPHMLDSMNDINDNMVLMYTSMSWMQNDLSRLRSSVGKPMKLFNMMPF
jgi:hypothetical protein